MSHLLQGVNTTAQWYQSSYPDAEYFSRLDKAVIHTTEVIGWPSYGGGDSAPNVTYYPGKRQTRQHFYSDRSARALKDPSSTTVRENRDNVFQLEVVCHSDYNNAMARGELWVGDLKPEHFSDIAALFQQLHDDLGLPLMTTVEWHEGRKTSFDDVRLSGSQFDSYKGILGHCHVSGNTHWDPGGFYISKLMAALEGEDMSWDDGVIKTDSGGQISNQQALEFLYNRQQRDIVDIDKIPGIDQKVTDLGTKIDGIEAGAITIDYDLLAQKVVQQLMTSAELAFRPASG